jgi:hypothetical protein
VIRRCLRSGEYYMEIQAYGGHGAVNDYGLLLESEPDPAVLADAGSNMCITQGGESAAVRLDGTRTSRMGYEEYQPSRAFVDITTTGVSLGRLRGEWWKGVLPFPDDFSFRFFGAGKRHVAVSVDMYLDFSTQWDYPYQPAAFSPEEPNDVIAPFWGIFGWAYSWGIFYEYRDVDGDGDRDLIVEWYNWETGDGVDPCSTFEAILYNGSGDIEFAYEKIATNSVPIPHVIGLENATGTEVIEHQGDVASGDSLGFRWVPLPLPETGMIDWSIERGTLPLLDISGSGTALNLGDDDSAEVVFTPNFAFDFYGVARQKLVISSNGYLTFGTSGNEPTREPVPDPGEPNSLIAPFWTDLDPGAGGSISYAFEDLDADGSDDLVVLWKDVPDKAAGVTRTFEAVLCGGTGNVEFRYGTDRVRRDLSSTTVGIENDKGTDGASSNEVIKKGASLVFRPYTTSNYRWFERGRSIATGIQPVVQLGKGCHTIELRAFGSGECSTPMGKDRVRVYVGESEKACAKCLNDEDSDETGDVDEETDE